MTSPNYFQLIATEIGIADKQVRSVSSLIDEGATIPFISRYRKEATGNLDEVLIASVAEKLKYYDELDKRKTTIIKTIEEQGKLTDDLRKKIEICLSASELEDIYLPYKPKRKTKAVLAIEKGLEPLAKLIYEQTQLNLIAEAKKYINDQVPDEDTALQGASDIIAEWIAEDQDARQLIRSLFTKSAILKSQVLISKKEDPEAQKYRDYFDFSESLHKCPSHRILAIRRAEKEGFLMMSISVDPDEALELLQNHFLKSPYESTQFVKKSLEDSYKRLLKPSIETEFRIASKESADNDAIAVFAGNLRQLLLGSPLGQKRVLAIDPGFRTGCKVVCLDETGSFLHYITIFPHAPQKQWKEAETTLLQLIEKYQIQSIGFGNGTASKETEMLVRGLQLSGDISIFMVNESGASIYSASDVAREEFPDQDVTVRGAISIGRRLLDPLSELVKIDPKSIGVGQYQHDVNQLKLRQQLDLVVESCVNYVGVNVNTASKHLLTYVAGLSQSIAKNIVEYRNQNGAFQSRSELLKVSGLGPKAFEQSAGFLRIPDAANPLDNSAVHPESYSVVEHMAQNTSSSITELIQNKEKRKKLNAHDYVTEEVGLFTIEDIIKELDKPGLDPRPPLEEFRFADGVSSLEDLREGMELPGIITNITNFGAFVNIGVKQDGMIHVSHLSDQFVKDPNQVVKLGQKVKARVLEIDIARGRVSLTLKGQNPNSPSKSNVKKKPQGDKPANTFQSQLEQLKSKFEK